MYIIAAIRAVSEHKSAKARFLCINYKCTIPDSHDHRFSSNEKELDYIPLNHRDSVTLFLPKNVLHLKTELKVFKKYVVKYIQLQYTNNNCMEA